MTLDLIIKDQKKLPKPKFKLYIKAFRGVFHTCYLLIKKMIKIVFLKFETDVDLSNT